MDSLTAEKMKTLSENELQKLFADAIASSLAPMHELERRGLHVHFEELKEYMKNKDGKRERTWFDYNIFSKEE